jgi:hypothetical protein
MCSGSMDKYDEGMPLDPWWLHDTSSSTDAEGLPLAPYCRGKTDSEAATAVSFEVHTSNAKVGTRGYVAVGWFRGLWA